MIVRRFVKDDPLSTIVNIFINDLTFKTDLFKKNNRIKNDHYSFSKYSKRVVFKNDRLFPKTKRLFWKPIEILNNYNRFRKRLTTLNLHHVGIFLKP